MTGKHFGGIAISRRGATRAGIRAMVALAIGAAVAGDAALAQTTFQPRGSSSDSSNGRGFSTGRGFGTSTGVGTTSTRSSDRDSSRVDTRSNRAESSRRTRSRRGEQEDNTGLDTATEGQGQAEGVPARSAPQAASAAPGRARSRGGATGAAVVVGDPGVMPKFELSEKIQSAAVYFSPAQVSTRPGERFSTPVAFFNPSARAIDRMEIWLKYPPDLLEPVAADTAELEPFAGGTIERSVWRKEGLVRIAAEFATPLKQLVQPLFSMGWRALDTPAAARVSLEAPAGETMGLFSDGVDVLSASAVGNRGVVSLEVLVAEDGEALDDRPLRILAPYSDPSVPDVRRGFGVRLGILPRSERVAAGEISTLDVVLMNPDVVEFDELRFRLRFDPEAVEILDADENNYSTNGINAYDGGFHTTHPFDRHWANHADLAAGFVEYHVGVSGGPRPYPSGTIARVVFRMKREVGGTTFWFDGVDPLSGRMITDVRANGESLLGSETVPPEEALHNATVAAR